MEAKAAQEGTVLTEAQLAALEKAKEQKEAHGEIETEHPGYLGAQDTFYIGTIKGVGRICRQTFIDTYSKVAFAKLYDRKNALVAADILNDRVVPFFEEHEYQLYLALENVEHTKTKTKNPQTNGICERFNKTVLNEFYRIAFRRKAYNSIGELQNDMDKWLKEYNEERTHSGKYCFGKTPMQTLKDSIPPAKEKILNSTLQTTQNREAQASG